MPAVKKVFVSLLYTQYFNKLHYSSGSLHLLANVDSQYFNNTCRSCVSYLHQVNQLDFPLSVYIADSLHYSVSVEWVCVYNRYMYCPSKDGDCDAVGTILSMKVAHKRT